ncbi:hypothetical protein, partial [Mesomycoplasma ovipneumoniae]|uniref:hypothetical protein n=1 Tax=Mesomycoplasma ovipneumoniae TaxID=29562 RepID=UPI00311A139A
LGPLRDQFSKAQIQGTNDLAKWVELSSNIFFDFQAGIIREPSKNGANLYKVDGSNDIGITGAAPSNRFAQDSASTYNLDFDLKG